MNRYLFTILTVFFIGFNGNAQTKAQKKTLKKFSRTYNVGIVEDGIFSIQTKKEKLYGLASIDGSIIVEPKFAWISNQNKAGHYVTAMQKISKKIDAGSPFLLGLRGIAIYSKLGKLVNTGNLDGIELQYRGGGNYEGDYLRTFKNSSGKMGLLNGSGQVLIEPKYDFIGSPSQQGLGYLFDKNTYGIYDLKKNSIGPLIYTPPISDYDIKEGEGFKGANNPALNWVINNGYVITSVDGINFGLLNYHTENVVFPEEYGYNFEQQQNNYVDEETIKNAVLIKARSTNRSSLYDSRTKTIFFDGTGFDNVWFFSPTDTIEWASVSKGYNKNNLYNIKTKTFLMDEFQERILLLSKKVAAIMENGGTRMYSIAKNDYLSDKLYDDVTVIPSKKIGSYNYVIKGPDYFYQVKQGKKYGVVDGNGDELTEIIYNDIPVITLGILSHDKTNILEGFIILESSKYMKTNNVRWTESNQAVLNVNTASIVLDGAKKILYDGKYLIKVEHERDPVTNAKVKYYTSYTTEGRQVSENRGYKF